MRRVPITSRGLLRDKPLSFRTRSHSRIRLLASARACLVEGRENGGRERIDFLFFFRVSRMQRIIGREEGKGNAPTSATTLCFRSCPPLATCRPPNNASFYGYLSIQFDSNEARARSIFQLIGSRCLDVSYSRKRFYPIFSCILKVYLVLCERDITRRGKNISRLPLVKIESNSRVNFEKRVNGKSK